MAIVGIYVRFLGCMPHAQKVLFPCKSGVSSKPWIWTSMGWNILLLMVQKFWHRFQPFFSTLDIRSPDGLVRRFTLPRTSRIRRQWLLLKTFRLSESIWDACLTWRLVRMSHMVPLSHKKQPHHWASWCMTLVDDFLTYHFVSTLAHKHIV